MEYPNIEYILTYGSNKTEDGSFVKGLFIAKKQNVVDKNITGIVIGQDPDVQTKLNGMNFEIHEKFMKDTTNNTIYSWNDLNIGIEGEQIYLVTNSSRDKQPKKIWELPPMLFNYLEIKYCYIYSIVLDNNELCIQMIKYRTTINNTNRVIWSKPIIITNKTLQAELSDTYPESDEVTLSLPKNSSSTNVDATQYKKALDSIYFHIKNKKIFLKDVELIQHNNTLLLLTKTIHKSGHVLGYIDTTDLKLGHE